MKKKKFIHPSVWFGFLILLIPLVAVAVAAADSPPSAAYRSLNVVSLNIRGGEGESRDPRELRWSKRKHVVAAELLRTRPDVIGLQEIMDIQFRDLQSLLFFYSAIGEPSMSTYIALFSGNPDYSVGPYNPIFYNWLRFRLIESGTRWLAPGAPSKRTKAFGAPLFRIFTYAKLREYETGRVFWVFNTHFSHRHDDDARRRRVSQAKVLHQFISDRARRYRICDASFYNEGELVTTQDIAIPFLEPVIVTGDFNSGQGESGASDKPFGILTKPLVDDVGGRPTGFLMQLLGGATAFNTPFYGNPSKVPVLSRFSISNAHGTLESTGKIFAPQGTDLSTIWDNFGTFEGIDWILSNEGFSPLDFQVISRTHNASGELYRNDNDEIVALSDIHDLMYASFIMTPDRSEQGQGVEIVTPRIFGKSYVTWPFPWSFYYNFDRVVVNGACR